MNGIKECTCCDKIYKINKKERTGYYIKNGQGANMHLERDLCDYFMDRETEAEKAKGLLPTQQEHVTEPDRHSALSSPPPPPGWGTQS